MKTTMIALIGIVLSIPHISFAQNEDFLKDYEAPYYRFRLLSVYFQGRSQGFTDPNTNVYRLNTGGSLFFRQFSNWEFYQGSIQSNLATGFFVLNDNSDVQMQFGTSLTNNTENRWYFKNNWLIGLHDRSRFHMSYAKSESANIDTTLLFTRINPTLSFGHGRLEPVNFARNAMDINRLLSKETVFDPSMTEEDMKILADKIGLIQNKRYYDYRLGRIYQLEAIDSTIESLGLSPERNMRYFSRLQDAYFYALYNPRFSGLRHEGGVTLGGIYDFDEYTATPGWSYLFYTFSAYIPQSYALQHNVKASINTEFATSWLTLEYTLGIYPTTRTAINLNFLSSGSYYTDNFGFLGKAGFDMTYYVSPRFRLNGGFNVVWNSDYIANGLINETTLTSFNRINYNANFSLSYAIF